jgi:hypothetical protein
MTTEKIMPIDTPPDITHYAMRAYTRYGGLMQSQPLTVDEQKYDDTCREIDRLEGVIGSKSMGLFTANEFIWFNYHVNKMYFFPKQDGLDRQLASLQKLLADLEARERH